MTDADFERNSRTLRQARAGQFEEITKLATAIGLIVAMLASAPAWLQIVLGVLIVVICVVTFPRWGRVKRFRRQDHRTGRNVKPEDV